MKIGVVGKGGVGKTTVAALLARAYADRRNSVVAVDTDSNPNPYAQSVGETRSGHHEPYRVTLVAGGGRSGDHLRDRQESGCRLHVRRADQTHVFGRRLFDRRDRNDN